GVDLEQIEDLGYENVETIKADMTDPKSKKIILDKIQGSADVVISDASPNITGTWDIDHARSMELCKHALEIAKSVLRQDGSFLAKAFQGEFFRDFLKDVGKSFEFHKASKPKASREKSAETYVVGKGYIG
ncbi:MAG: SAM-dependent methyltransferase, partial [Candidatus Hadarchaeia archaeon]